MSRHLDLADRVIALVGDRAEAQVTVTGGVSTLTRFANSYIHQNVGEEGSAVVLKVAVDGRVTTATTTNIVPDALARFVDEAIAAARLQPRDPDWPGPAAAVAVPDVEHYDEATAAVTPADRAGAVGEFVDAGPGMRAAGFCDTEGTTIAFANTAGHRVERRATKATLDGIHQTDSSAGSGHATFVDFASIDGSAVGALAADRARRGQDAYDVKPGEYEVVLAPEAVATMLIFLAFYGFNAKQHIEGQSFARVGEQQFDPAVNVWDDATDPAALGVVFDADGTPKRRVDLVAGGTTAGLAHDRRTARKAGAESTGHAVPGGDVYGPIPSNLFMGGGTTALDDLIGAVDRGLYVATFNYCRILDPKTQVVTGLTRNGTFMIENGEITGAVTNLRFTQSFLTALGEGRVLGIGDDIRFADSEFGPGLVRAPTLRLAGWRFTGGAEG